MESEPTPEVDGEAMSHKTPAGNEGRGYRSKRAPYGQQLGYRKDGKCHIDGLPCERAARCNETPYLVCANCRVRVNVSYSWNVCARCERKGECRGLACYLAPYREGGKTILKKGTTK